MFGTVCQFPVAKFITYKLEYRLELLIYFTGRGRKWTGMFANISNVL